MWTRSGLKITIATLPKSVFFPRAVKGEFSISLGCNSSSTGEPVSQLRYVLGAVNLEKGFGGSNYGHYISAKLDTMVAKAEVALDDLVRNELSVEASEIAMRDEVVIIPMLFPITNRAMRNGITYGGFLQDTTVASMVRVAR